MRRHQKKIVKQLADLYQSNDPLRWYDMKVMTHGWIIAQHEATPRERKLAHRRMMRGVKELGAAFKRLGVSAAEAARNMARAIAGDRVVSVSPRNHGKTMIAHSISHGIYAPKVVTSNLPAIRISSIVEGGSHDQQSN